MYANQRFRNFTHISPFWSGRLRPEGENRKLFSIFIYFSLRSVPFCSGSIVTSHSVTHVCAFQPHDCSLATATGSRKRAARLEDWGSGVDCNAARTISILSVLIVLNSLFASFFIVVLFMTGWETLVFCVCDIFSARLSSLHLVELSIISQYIYSLIYSYFYRHHCLRRKQLIQTIHVKMWKSALRILQECEVNVLELRVFQCNIGERETLKCPGKTKQAAATKSSYGPCGFALMNVLILCSSLCVCVSLPPSAWPWLCFQLLSITCITAAA